MKHLLFFLGFIFTFYCTAQNYADKDYYLIDSLSLDELTSSDKNYIDSSLALFHNSNHDTSKIKSLNIICENMMHDDWSKYQKYQYKLILNAQKKYPELHKTLDVNLADALNNLGYIIYNHEGDFEKSIEFFLQSLEIQERLGEQKGLATSYTNIGFLFNKHGHVKKALKYYFKGLKIREGLNDKKGMGYSLNNIGSVYIEQGNDSLGLEYYQKSKKIRLTINDKQGLANSYHNIGGVYRGQKNYKLALQCFNKSLKIQKEIGFKRGEVESLLNIGGIHVKQKKHAIALDNYKRSLRTSIDINYKQGKANSLNKMAYLFFELGKIDGNDGALIYAEKSNKLFIELGNPRDILETAKLLSKIYEAQGKGMQALKMHKIYVQMRDSINNEETHKTAIKQQIEYEYEKKEHVLKLEKEKQEAVSKEKVARKNIVIYAVSTIMGLCIIFLIYQYNRFLIIRKQKKLIEIQSDKINDSISYAQRIQNAILPSSSFFKNNFTDSFIYFKPKDVVSGDFYWVYKTNNKVFFSVIDCTGHGVPGAFMSLISNNLLDKVVAEKKILSPEKILQQLDIELTSILTRDNEVEVNDGMDLMLCCIDTETKKLTFSGARNILLHVRGGNVKEYYGDRMNIGGDIGLKKANKNKVFSLNQIQLKEEDNIYLFSDGYIDQFGGEKRKKFYLSNFLSLIKEVSKLSMNEQMISIDKNITTWMNDGNYKQIDDICVMGIKV